MKNREEIDYMLEMLRPMFVRKLSLLKNDAACRIQYVGVEDSKFSGRIYLKFKDSKYGITFMLEFNDMHGIKDKLMLNLPYVYSFFKILKYETLYIDVD